jgi:hypothetical protein
VLVRPAAYAEPAVARIMTATNKLPEIATNPVRRIATLHDGDGHRLGKSQRV